MKGTLTVVFLAMLLSGCGSTDNMTPVSKVGSPSGNWMLTAQDAQGHTFGANMVLDLTGSTLTATHPLLTHISNPNPSCFPYDVTLSNGNVSGTMLSGTLTVKSTSGVDMGMHFTGNLASDGLSISSGTYTLDSAGGVCSPLEPSGTFTGTQVPSVSGDWTGTIQMCNVNAHDGSCTPTGQSGTISATVTQDDSTGRGYGTYSVSNLAGFSSGTIGDDAFNILSGQTWGFMLKDGNGSVRLVWGAPEGLGSPAGISGRTFIGSVTDTASNHYLLHMSH